MRPRYPKDNPPGARKLRAPRRSFPRAVRPSLSGGDYWMMSKSAVRAGACRPPESAAIKMIR